MPKINNEYDIGKAFEAIENELIASMIRNMKSHKLEEIDEDKQWTMWQAEMLKSLEKYKKENEKKYAGKFKDINKQIKVLIQMAKSEGEMSQEIEILKEIQNGFKTKRISKGTYGKFFRLNERKLEALIKATTEDMEKAETAILRRANDQYRKVIYNAQVYANSGAGTYEKAVDMATHDMLAAGLNCIEYANGARHRLKDYADMAIRTASKRAYLQGEGQKRQEWGITTVIMNKRGNPCPKCLPFVGKVLVDDVWSGGRSDGVDPETGKKYPTMSYAISKGLYHPRCKDSHTTYFPGISTADDTWTKKELEDIGIQAKQEAKQQYAERQAEKFGRLAKYSLDEENQKLYESRAGQWRNVRFKTGGLDSRKYVESKRPLANFRALPKEQVANVLRKESEEWIKSLSDIEKHAIKKYTYNSGDKKPNRFFERLNAMLRGDLLEDEKLREYAETISEALKKNRIKHDTIVYRGVAIDPSEGIPINGIYRAKQFFSTSVSEKRALGGSYKIIIYVRKGTPCAYIEELSYFKSQQELLLDKDCIYRVISRKGNMIELEVI